MTEVGKTIRPSSQANRGLLLKDALAVAAVSVGILSPALFTQNGFAGDWTNGLWLAWVQQHAISTHLVPTYYLNAGAGGRCPGCGVGVFYPQFMFYGGTFYAAIGALAVLLGGNVIAAALAFMLLGVAAAYGGGVWLARQLGVSSWMAHLPSLTFVTSAYYISDFYTRGDWTEWVATSMLPLLLACVVRLLRAPRFEFIPAALGTVAAVIFAGTHNLTLLLGTVFCTTVLAGTVIAFRGDLHVNLRRLAQILALLSCAVAVDAWFLLPDIVYGPRTIIANHELIPWGATAAYNTLGMLFNPLRATSPRLPGPFVQAPDWILLWVLIATVVAWRKLTGAFRHLLIWLLVLLELMVAAIVSRIVWNTLPFHDLLQFPYRLNMYVALDVAAAVLVLIVGTTRDGNRSTARGSLSAAAVVAAMVSVGLCIWQLWVPDVRASPGISNRNLALQTIHVLPPTWYAYNDYADSSQKITRTTGAITIDPTKLSGSAATMSVDPPAGAGAFATNIGGGPYAVRITGGIRAIGRTRAGLVVAERTDPHGSGPVSVTLSPPTSGVLVAGKTISVVAVIALCLASLVALTRRRLTTDAP